MSSPFQIIKQATNAPQKKAAQPPTREAMNTDRWVSMQAGLENKLVSNEIEPASPDPAACEHAAPEYAERRRDIQAGQSQRVVYQRPGEEHRKGSEYPPAGTPFSHFEQNRPAFVQPEYAALGQPLTPPLPMNAQSSAASALVSPVSTTSMPGNRRVNLERINARHDEAIRIAAMERKERKRMDRYNQST